MIRETTQVTVAWEFRDIPYIRVQTSGIGRHPQHSAHITPSTYPENSMGNIQVRAELTLVITEKSQASSGTPGEAWRRSRQCTLT